VIAFYFYNTDSDINIASEAESEVHDVTGTEDYTTTTICTFNNENDKSQ